MIQPSVIRVNDGARYLSILLNQVKLFWGKNKTQLEKLIRRDSRTMKLLCDPFCGQIFLFFLRWAEKIVFLIRTKNATGKCREGATWRGEVLLLIRNWHTRKCMLQMCMSKKPPHTCCWTVFFFILYFSFQGDDWNIFPIFIYSSPQSRKNWINFTLTK